MPKSTHREEQLVNLDCSVLAVTSLSSEDRLQLFHLISSHFDRVDQAAFFHDLDDKKKIILLQDVGGTIRGFATMTLIEANLASERIAAVYAGDTVIDPECWGHSSWLYAWARNGFAWRVIQELRKPNCCCSHQHIAVIVFCRDFFTNTFLAGAVQRRARCNPE